MPRVSNSTPPARSASTVRRYVYTQFLYTLRRLPMLAPPRSNSHAALPSSAARSHAFSRVLGFQSNCTSEPPQQYFISTTGRPVSDCSRSPSESSGPKVLRLLAVGVMGVIVKSSGAWTPW